MKNEERFEKVTEWQEFVSGKEPADWVFIFLLGIPFIGTFIVLNYLIFGRERTYFRKISKIKKRGKGK